MLQVIALQNRSGDENAADHTPQFGNRKGQHGRVCISKPDRFPDSSGLRVSGLARVIPLRKDGSPPHGQQQQNQQIWQARTRK